MATVPDRACRARLRMLWRWYTGDTVPPQSADINDHTHIGGLEARYALVNGIIRHLQSRPTTAPGTTWQPSPTCICRSGSGELCSVSTFLIGTFTYVCVTMDLANLPEQTTHQNPDGLFAYREETGLCRSVSLLLFISGRIPEPVVSVPPTCVGINPDSDSRQAS